MDLVEIEPIGSSVNERRWRRRLRHVYARAQRAVPFALGVLATLVAFLLCSVVPPVPPQLTMREVNDSIAQALASAVRA